MAATQTKIYVSHPIGAKWSLLLRTPTQWHLANPTCTASGSFCLDTASTGEGALPGGREVVIAMTNPLAKLLPTVALIPRIAVKLETFLPANVTDFGVSSASCPTSLVCEGVSGFGVWRTSNGGASWQRQLGPDSPLLSRGLSTVVCPTISTCLAGTGNGSFVITNDGGQSWHTITTPWSLTSIQVQGAIVSGIACISRTNCVATIWEYNSSGHLRDARTALIVSTANAGRTWSQQYSQLGGVLNNISCSTTLGCFAGGWEAGTRSNTALFVRAAVK